MAAKCGHCNTGLVKLSVEGIVAEEKPGSGFKSVAFTCPHCTAVLGVQINPLILNQDMITELKKPADKAAK